MQGVWTGGGDGPLTKVGELVGYAVSASARALPQMATVQERTDVVLVPWRDSSIQPFSSQAIQFKR